MARVPRIPDLALADAGVFIRGLGDAVQARTLDERGLLEELGRAVRSCRELAKHHEGVAGEYMVAQAKYLAAAKAMCKRLKEPFVAWCRASGLSYDYSSELSCLGERSDVPAAVRAWRDEQRTKSKSHRKRVGRSLAQDPTLRAQTVWAQMDLPQRMAFLEWVANHCEDEPQRRSARSVAQLLSRLDKPQPGAGD